ncbi:MAG: NAD(P)H-dependent glycerol-3-phosphate dehydrogenase [Candidatus Kapaibacterium sp.]
MKTAVIGAGGWGTTISLLLSQGGHDVTLWARSEEFASLVSLTRENPTYLPGIKIPTGITITHDAELLRNKDLYVIAVPSQSLREVTTTLLPFIKNQTAVYVSASKGIERHTLKRMTEIIQEVIGVDKGRTVSFSGPSHAEEVARGIPTLVTAAASDSEAAKKIVNVFFLPNFRVYSTTDVIGVELSGALKNVIAICAGIIEGEGYGDNTVAALISRGLAEIRRLGIALGADEQTFAGIAGLGDLVVTCLSKHSRNRYVGEEVGKGKTLTEVLSGMKMVAEGVWTTESARELAKLHNIEMPIVEETYKILFEGKDHRMATRDLMRRESKDERW